jgi:hypothetical protein
MSNTDADLIKALRALEALAKLMEVSPPQARKVIRAAIKDQLRKG